MLSYPSVEIAPKQTAKREHVTVLDGLRGIAIILVLMVHSVPHIAGKGIVIEAINAFVHNGVFGVDLFFVLSGFLITGILLDSKEASGYFRTFYVRRALRLFPVYYGFLVVMIWVVPAFHRAAHLNLPEYKGTWWWYLLYFSNWRLHHEWDASLGHFWSLALEEQFYFFWPLTVYLLSRRALVAWCGVLIAVAVGMRWTLVGKGVDLYAITPSRMDALCIGALLALCFRDDLWRARILRHRRLLGFLTLTAFLVSDLQNWRYPWNPLSAFFAATWFGMLVFQGAANDFGPACSKLLSRPLLVKYGRYSYCIYVVQLLFLDHGFWLSVYLRAHTRRVPGIVATALVMGVANAMIYWVARGSWRYFEKPVLGLRDRLAPG